MRSIDLCLTLLLMVSVVQGAEGPHPERPNVILIMADDLGYESLACNGGTSYETPVFDRLARRGMRFTHCYSQPICTPSRNKIVTGRSNARNYRKFGDLDPAEITFGTLMRDAGYRTAIAGKWQLTGSGGLVHGTGTTPKKCGFEQSCMWAYERDVTPEQADAYFANFPVGPKRKMSRFWYPGILVNEEPQPTTIDDYGPDIFSDFLLDFMQQHQKEPFFIYYPMVLTHNPFVPTPGTPGLTDELKFTSDANNFGDMIRYTGKLVERFLRKLDELGLAENTLVIFTADNGTYRSLESRMGDRVVIGGKALPLDAGVHVPMLAWWQGVVKEGSVCNSLIEFSDFLPTIAEAGRAQLPADRPIDGRSFLARLKGDSYTPRESVFVHYDKSPDKEEPEFRRVRFAFDGRFKLYLDGQMFDVPEDHEEEHPLGLAGATEEISSAREKLQKVLDSMPVWEPDNRIFRGQPDALTLERRARLNQIRARQIGVETRGAP